MKKSEMFEILASVMLQWPHIVISEATVALWHRSFEDESKENFLNAIIAAMKTSRSGFPPTIGEVNAMLVTLATPPDEQITEGEAWRLLKDAIRKFGYMQPMDAYAWLEARSTRIAECARQIGWREICEWKTDDEVANRAHFWRIHLGMVQRDERADFLGIARPRPLTLMEARANSKPVPAIDAPPPKAMPE